MSWTADHIPDQTDRVAVVTGANSGIGFETTKALADHGGTVIMACRNRSRADDAKRRVQEAVQGADLHVEDLDLASVASIEAFAERVRASDWQVDLLINNAGIMGVPRRETADGFEAQFGINHLGHFALTGLLLDRLRQGGRVVTVSSGMHERGSLDFDDLHGEESYGRWDAYGASKLANVLFAYELDRRLEADGRDVISLAAHPGYADTRLQDRAAGSSTLRRLGMRVLNAVLAQPAAAGALPILYAATGPEVSRRSYVGAGGFMNMRGPPTEQPSAPATYDADLAARLWEHSVALTGVTYELPEAATE